MVFVVHAHQPVGNHEFVVKEAFNKAYLPFLKTALKYPQLRFGLHISGCLYDVAEQVCPQLFTIVEELLARSQVELITGGYYEPIMSLLPENDSMGQIRMHIEYLRRRFKAEPEGIWLAERVWEQQFVSIIAKNRLRYTLLDDNHLRWAGIIKEHITGYYITEYLGNTINVFPIDERLRYLIPFHDLEEVLGYLKGFGDGDTLLTYGDDMEKFGLWGNSHRRVYKEGWLRRFCESLAENGDWLQLVLPQEALDGSEPEGKVSIPECSYRELTEWALLPDAYAEYRRANERLRESGMNLSLIGAPFRNFLVKYPEASRMYGRMLEVSEMVAKEDDEGKREKATLSLYKAQCNCAYWHGVFGGLHFSFLRDAVYRNLLEAEETVLGGVVDIRKRDVELDGKADVRMDTLLLRVFVGGCSSNIFELDYNPRRLNLANTLSRRRENYHRRGVLTDPAPRHIGEQYIVPPDTPPVALRNPRYRAENSQTVTEPEMRHLPTVLETAALIRLKNPKVGEVEINKRTRLRKKEASLSVTYLVSNPTDHRLSLLFVSESNFSVPEFDGLLLLPKGREESLSRIRTYENIETFSLIHKSAELAVRASFEEGDCLFYPVKTRIPEVFSRGNPYLYQCFCCSVLWRMEIEPEEVVVRELRIDVEER